MESTCLQSLLAMPAVSFPALQLTEQGDSKKRQKPVELPDRNTPSFCTCKKKEATKQFQSSDHAIFTDDKTMREKK